MSAPQLATQIVRDLVLIGSVPIHVDQIDGWWIVSSAKDWLLEPDGSVSLWNFSHIAYFPEAGREACHSEILLSAFANAVVTKGADEELIWVIGSPDVWMIPANVLTHIQNNSGRTIAFTA
jgi:hypothetical protein